MGNSDVGFVQCITVTGGVRLILADGCTLDAGNDGINAADGNGLTICGQQNGTGALTAEKPGDYSHHS